MSLQFNDLRFRAQLNELSFDRRSSLQLNEFRFVGRPSLHLNELRAYDSYADLSVRFPTPTQDLTNTSITSTMMLIFQYVGVYYYHCTFYLL